MKPKFTPGPWYPVIATKPDNTKNMIVVAGSPAIESASRIVCIVTPLEYEDAEDEPNAQAISLIPDMYAVLEQLLIEWEIDWAEGEPRELSDLERKVQYIVSTLNPDRYAVPDDEKPDYNELVF